MRQTDPDDFDDGGREERRRANRRKQNLKDIEILLRNPAFRAWVLQKITSCGIFSRGFLGSSEAYYRQGRRDVGLEILEDIMQADPEAGADMIIKARSADARDRDGDHSDD